MNQLSYFLVLSSLLFACPAFGAMTVLQCGKLVDVTAGVVSGEASIRIEDNRISAVEQGYATPPQEARSVDLKTQTCMPGLIDSHTHISGQLSKQSYMSVIVLS